MYKVYAISDIGKKRTTNQDGFFVDGIVSVGEQHREIYYESDANQIHIAVCDGVGSTQYATEAVNRTLQGLANSKAPHNAEDIENMVLQINLDVFNELKERHHEDAATTISGIIYNGNGMFSYNIGDSSVFSVNNGYLEKQTVDDTGEELFGYEEFERNSKPLLIQTIGTKAILDKIHISKIINGSLVILCTDGVTDVLTVDDLEEILEAGDNMKSVCRTIVKNVNDKGGDDNITIVLIAEEE